MTIASGLSVPTAELAKVCRRHQVKELSVFGSAAYGELRPDSDVDLLVEFLPQAARGLLKLAAMEEEFSALLGRKIDLVSKRGLNKTIRDEVLSRARPIYEA